DSITRFTVTGATLKRMLEHWMRPENRLSGEGECYQVNGSVRSRYSDSERRLVSLDVRGSAVEDDGRYTVGLQGYHVSNCEPYLGVTLEDLTAAGPSKVVTTSARQVIDEWLRANQHAGRRVEGRLVYV
ncbi:MAG: 5'-nucleotidase C-terminal domain-containing protein, partial [Coriobacteriia bacterium]|nr:5'-nucleotidase C-terminal domain-containing protein [Coriobacteriia bacterium]